MTGGVVSLFFSSGIVGLTTFGSELTPTMSGYLLSAIGQTESLSETKAIALYPVVPQGEPLSQGDLYLRVLDINLSTGAITPGTEKAVDTDKKFTPLSLDYNVVRMSDSKGLASYSYNPGSVTVAPEQYVVAFTISGTTITTGTPVFVRNADQHNTICRFDTDKALILANRRVFIITLTGTTAALSSAGTVNDFDGEAFVHALDTSRVLAVGLDNSPASFVNLIAQVIDVSGATPSPVGSPTDLGFDAAPGENYFIGLDGERGVVAWAPYSNQYEINVAIVHVDGSNNITVGSAVKVPFTDTTSNGVPYMVRLDDNRFVVAQRTSNSANSAFELVGYRVSGTQIIEDSASDPLDLSPMNVLAALSPLNNNKFLVQRQKDGTQPQEITYQLISAT